MARSSTRRTIAAAAATLGLLFVTGCGSGSPAGPSAGASAVRPRTPAPASTASGTPIEVTYDARVRDEGQTVRLHAVLIAAGPRSARYVLESTGFSPRLYVYDGHRLLVHDAGDVHPWSLYVAAAEHLDVLSTLTDLLAGPHSTPFADSCRSATVIGHRTILNHPAVGYHCAERTYADGSTDGAYDTWRDQATGLMLTTGPVHATAISDRVRVTAATFATDPPPGVEVAVYAAKKASEGSLQEAASFTLDRVDAQGTATLADYAHGPFVLAFFSSGLYFDPHGETCPHCVPALLALQRLTDDGTRPRVLAVQTGDVGKPGLLLVPHGLRLAVANDPQEATKRAYGLSHQVGFAFVGSDGKIHQRLDEAPTDQQLRDALRALH